MMPPLLWRWHHSGCMFILSVFGLCLGINVSSWSFQNFYAHGAVTARRASYQALQSSTSLHEDQSSGDGDSRNQKEEHGKFALSGSICGQKHEYLLDNINCSAGNEIKFCGTSYSLLDYSPKYTKHRSRMPSIDLLSWSLYDHHHNLTLLNFSATLLFRSNIASSCSKMDNSSEEVSDSRY